MTGRRPPRTVLLIDEEADGALRHPPARRLGRAGRPTPAAARSTAVGERMPDDVAWIRSYVTASRTERWGRSVSTRHEPRGDSASCQPRRPAGRRDREGDPHRDRPARPGSDRDIGRGEHTGEQATLDLFGVTLPLVIVMIAALGASAAPPAATPTVTHGWVTGLQECSGSTVGPTARSTFPSPRAARSRASIRRPGR